MQITKDVLTAIGVSSENADKHLEALNDAMGRHGIDTQMRIAHFLAQIGHESAHLKAVAENLNYSTDGLLKVFGKYFKSRAQAEAYARQPQKIASRVYADRMGNGAEPTGDGYRYRGRGFIQLTGKSNYEAFSKWIGVDCVADPDSVAERFAAHSAVFYWDKNGLNALADTDNLTTITKRINGGLNGFDERRALLTKAKRALAAQPAEATRSREATRAPQAASAEGPAPTHRVSAGGLNLRREPRSDRPNQIATLPQGTRVQRLGAPDAQGWVQVRVMLSGALRDGFVASKFLTPVPPGASFAIEAETLAGLVLPPALLQQGKAESARSQSSHRLFPLGEGSRPKVNGSTPETLAKQLLDGLAWLDCEDPTHVRYRAPKGGSVASTYACDYCELAGVYLPRVWWTPESLVGIAEERKVEVELNRSVRELSTNGLYDWLEDHGSAFGWHREIEAIELQAAANAGEVCLIVAKSTDLSRAGQIAAVVPEHEGCQAKRDKAGDVLRPVESHCGGAKNVRCAKAASAWWLSDRYQAYAFWRHPLGKDA